MTPETVTLKAETFDNVLNMLNSVDPENRVVALSCIENVDFKTNLVYIMLLKKQGDKATTAEWKEHAPKVCQMLSSININLDNALTYKQILEILTKHKVSAEDIQFYLDKFARTLFTSIKGLGYEFIDSLEINLKLKTANGEQIGTISESIKGPNA
jgi:hypothetical protein